MLQQLFSAANKIKNLLLPYLLALVTQERKYSDIVYIIVTPVR